MKKLLSVFAVLFVMGTANLFASRGVGLQAGPNFGRNVNATGAITFKLESVPCVFALSIPNFDPFVIGLTADWWIANPGTGIDRNWKWFYGVGFGTFFHTGTYAAFGLGGRAVIGTDFYLFNKFLELYAQIAWQPMIWISEGVSTDLVNFPLDIGFRFWF